MHKHRSVCSTPFGIKEGFTFGKQMIADAKYPVLNAFRHQRGIHPLVGHISCGLCHVLNAFRHQRGIHTPQMEVVRKLERCSTPFGIKEGFTIS